jgi:hypothetical protein
MAVLFAAISLALSASPGAAQAEKAHRAGDR